MRERSKRSRITRSRRKKCASTSRHSGKRAQTEELRFAAPKDRPSATRLLMSSFGIETITFHNTLIVADEIGLEVQFHARAQREAARTH